MKNIKKRVLVSVLAVVMALCSVIGIQETAFAATAPKMTKSTVTVELGKKKTVKLTKKTVQKGWKISNVTVSDKNVATVSVKNTKVVVNGKKEGNTKLDVVVIKGTSKKNLTINVSVKAAQTKYTLDYYCTRSDNGMRQFRDYSIDGDYSGYGVSATYGEHHGWNYYNIVLTQDELDKLTTVAPGGKSSGSQWGYNKSDSTGYVINVGDSTGMIFFITETTK